MLDAEGERREGPHGGEARRAPRAERQERGEEKREGGEVVELAVEADDEDRDRAQGVHERPHADAPHAGLAGEEPDEDRCPGIGEREEPSHDEVERQPRGGRDPAEEGEEEEPEGPVVVAGGLGVDVAPAGDDLRDDAIADLVVVPVRTPGEPQPEGEPHEDSRPDEGHGGRGEAAALPRLRHAPTAFATCSASRMNALETVESGSDTMIGVPASP